MRRRSKRAQQVEAEATALLSANPVEARPEAGRRPQDGEGADIFAHWDRVMQKVALLTAKPVCPESAKKTADDGETGDQEPDLVERLARFLEMRDK